MVVETIGEKEYLEAIKSNNELWVLMCDNQVYMLNCDGSNAIPTWHTKEKANSFSRLANIGMSPVSIPLHLFKGSWLKSTEYVITEVIASPRYGFPGLTFTKAEFLNA